MFLVLFSTLALAWEPTADEKAVYDALLPRHPTHTCAEVDALVERPLDALLGVVAKATVPSWVPMRAAGCVIERHAATAEPQLVAWVGDAEKRGLALLVLGAVDELPPEVARSVTAAALAGPHAALAEERVVSPPDAPGGLVQLP